jgi:carboxyl-terminal processing protease
MLRRRLGSLLPLALLLLLSACGGGESPTSPSSTAAGMSTTARSYLDQILSTMQASSINRQTIDWTAFRASVNAAAPNAQTIPDLYPAIRTALGLLGDHHSYYQGPDGTYVYNPSPRGGCSDPTPPSADVPNSIGYVKVIGFSGTTAQATQFAQGIQDTLRAADRPDLAGWIVDVRNNGGGNMWPMIAGVGPILGDGTAGAFIDPTGYVTWWGYRSDASYWGDNTAVAVPSPYHLLRQNPRVAVLTNCAVASSGEAMVIAFRARPNTRSFGTATYGLSTSNQTITLNGGGTLMLTTATMADRTGAKYGDVVVPDEIIADPTETVRRAIQWLQGGV